MGYEGWLRPLGNPLYAGLLVAALAAVLAIALLWDQLGKHVRMRDLVRVFIYLALACCTLTFVHYKMVMKEADARVRDREAGALFEAISVAPSVMPARAQPEFRAQPPQPPPVQPSVQLQPLPLQPPLQPPVQPPVQLQPQLQPQLQLQPQPLQPQLLQPQPPQLQPQLQVLL